MNASEKNKNRNKNYKTRQEKNSGEEREEENVRVRLWKRGQRGWEGPSMLKLNPPNPPPLVLFPEASDKFRRGGHQLQHSPLRTPTN